MMAPVTPEEARRVWESMDRPSCRRVALALTQSGRPVGHDSISRWRRAGWQAGAPRQPPQPRAELDAAVPVLTGDPQRRLDSLPALALGRGEASPEADQDDLTDAERARRTFSDLLDATRKVAQHVARDPGPLIRDAPDRLGVLIERTSNAAVAALEGFEKLNALAAETATPIEASSTAQGRAEPTAEQRLKDFMRRRDDPACGAVTSPPPRGAGASSVTIDFDAFQAAAARERARRGQDIPSTEEKIQ